MGDWFESVEDTAAGFAAKNFFVGFSGQDLNGVWQDAHATTFALIVADFSQRGTGMLLGNAVVELDEIFRNSCRDLQALRIRGFQFFLLVGVLHFDLFFLEGDDLFGFLEFRFDALHPALGFFNAHHLIKDEIFGFGGFRVSIGNFVLESFVGFVGFYGAALGAILFGAILPLLNVELEFSALRLSLCEGFLGGSDSGPRASQFGVGFAHFFR